MVALSKDILELARKPWFPVIMRELGYEKIIRCKECKHWGIHKRLNIPWCREMHIDRGAEDFCNVAERRTDECTIEGQTTLFDEA